MIFIFGMQINIDVLRACATRHAQSTQNKKFVSFCNISGKALREGGGWGVKLIFCLQTNPKVFVKLIVSLWVYAARHAESNQNNKFTISFQYLKENVKGEFDLLPTDKRQRFLQTAFIILGVCDQPCPNYPK